MRLVIIPLMLFCSILFAQDLKEFNTKVEYEFDFGIVVKNDWKKREQLLKDLSTNKKSWDNLTEEESVLFEKYGESYDSMWDTEGGGCSWYCGAGNYTVKASSTLENQKQIFYNASNINDFSYETAWVEGVEGNGIGQYIEFEFIPEHPRVTVVKIANGYVKSKELWRNNSRVKTFRMYVNDKFHAIINLQNVYGLQSFELNNPIGNNNRKDPELLKNFPKWRIKFEILDVYQGTKYSDTVITEIFFDGIDVH